MDNRLEDPDNKSASTCEVLNKWLPLLEHWGNNTTDEHEKEIVLKMHQSIKDLKDRLNSQRV